MAHDASAAKPTSPRSAPVGARSENVLHSTVSAAVSTSERSTKRANAGAGTCGSCRGKSGKAPCQLGSMGVRLATALRTHSVKPKLMGSDPIAIQIAIRLPVALRHQYFFNDTSGAVSDQRCAIDVAPTRNSVAPASSTRASSWAERSASMRRRNNATGAVVEDETKITCARSVAFDTIARRLAPDVVTTNARPFVASAPATRSGSTNTNDGSVRA